MMLLEPSLRLGRELGPLLFSTTGPLHLSIGLKSLYLFAIVLLCSLTCCSAFSFFEILEKAQMGPKKR